ncbi:MAG TPA: hypothetical protein DCS29_04520 [Candidatus Magasanikbacteria bacterium]|nr:MAG: hypothetical protein A2479_01185 [Candidatus Magasanikbacteria bacterium RIFOXYC2_FULL_39_8]HAT04005.1 hypothetical protein [Candidatus Magasanikbacteria bacterium]
MSLETEQSELRRSREAQERAVESRESKEKEVSEDVKAAATMERADFLVKEVKGSKQQIQNIMLHMQQVLQAITALRQQLQIQTDDATNSVEQDKERVEKLKEKIAAHKDELLKMKDELITAQAEQIREGEGAGMSDEKLRERAQEMVERIMEGIKN